MPAHQRLACGNGESQNYLTDWRSMNYDAMPKHSDKVVTTATCGVFCVRMWSRTPQCHVGLCQGLETSQKVGMMKGTRTDATSAGNAANAPLGSSEQGAGVVCSSCTFASQATDAEYPFPHMWQLILPVQSRARRLVSHNFTALQRTIGKSICLQIYLACRCHKPQTSNRD